MELIPILSTIILVATISTFLLAIGAYILYKIRESRGEQIIAPQPATVQAELVTPAVAPEPAKVEQPYYQPQPAPVNYMAPQPIFVEQPVAQQYAAPARSFERAPAGQFAAEQGANQPRGYRAPNVARSEKKNTESRFMKYTTEGYVSAKEDKTLGALKWK